MPAQRSVVSSAKLIAVCTLISRITGLARDILLARAFGLAWVQDAWVYAFQFPNLFRRLFGEGAMAAAFVPTFTRMLESEGKESAWRLLARTLALLTVVLAALIVVIAAIIAVIWLCSSGAGEKMEARRLLLSLTALMLPFMLTICVLALFSSILNCVGSFVPAALAPVLLNICMIVGIGWLAPALRPEDDHGQVYVIALTVVIAGIIQILYILPVLRSHGVRLGWRWELNDPAVKRMLRLVVPVLLGQGVLAFGVFLDAQICILLTHKSGTAATATLLGWTFTYPLEEGALSAVTYAQRLYQFPLGVLVISLATAALPAFSRLATRRDWPAWTAEVRQSLRLAVFEGILAGTMMIMLAVPIVRLLFERGDFTAADSVRAGRILTLYGFGLWAFCAQHIVLRAFYSLGDVRTPVTITAILLPLNIAMNLVLIWMDAIREAAFAISTCTTSALAVIVGLLILQRRLERRLLDGETLLATVKMLISASMAAMALWVIHPFWIALAEKVTIPLLSRAVETLGLLAIGSGVFLFTAWLLRSREFNMLITRRR
ncbi:MAG: murein biosynthesis integral membrane protein MurJ [Phycisphaerae bacterium]|nr:murein biosynthesis integral membrane protein MurJ [Phycisphaerae bacterium]